MSYIEEELDEEKEEIQIEKLGKTHPNMEDNKPQVHGLMKEVNLDIIKQRGAPYINYLSYPNLKEYIISLLQEFKDCLS